MRLRIVLGYSALLVVALLVATLLTRHALLTRLDQKIEGWSTHQAEEFATDSELRSPATGAPFRDSVGDLFDVFTRNHVPTSDQAFYTFIGDMPYAASLDAPAAVMADPAVIDLWTRGRSPISGEISTSDGTVVYLTVPVIDSRSDHVGTFVVATYPDSERGDISTMLWILVTLGAVLVTVAVVLGLSLARHVLRPVRRLTETALQIEESDLSTRIPVSGDDELAQLGRTFNAMLDRLEESFHSQRAFLDDVAHELRTPITIVRGHLELLGHEPGERDQTIAVVTDELDRMARSVNELLVVAKAARPDFLHPTLVDIHELMQGVLARASALAPRDWQIGACPRLTQAIIVADFERLTQALLALSSNAVDHSPAHSPIIFDAHVSNEQVVLAVTDHGSGVDPAIRDRLFTRFTRAAASEIGRPEGAGLGLAIVASIANAHGGRVDVNSTVGQGATFSLVLPRRDPMEDDER